MRNLHLTYALKDGMKIHPPHPPHAPFPQTRRPILRRKSSDCVEFDSNSIYHGNKPHSKLQRRLAIVLNVTRNKTGTPRTHSNARAMPNNKGLRQRVSSEEIIDSRTCPLSAGLSKRGARVQPVQHAPHVHETNAESEKASRRIGFGDIAVSNKSANSNNQICASSSENENESTPNNITHMRRRGCMDFCGNNQEPVNYLQTERRRKELAVALYQEIGGTCSHQEDPDKSSRSMKLVNQAAKNNDVASSDSKLPLLTESLMSSITMQSGFFIDGIFNRKYEGRDLPIPRVVSLMESEVYGKPTQKEHQAGLMSIEMPVDDTYHRRPSRNNKPWEDGQIVKSETAIHHHHQQQYAMLKHQKGHFRRITMDGLAAKRNARQASHKGKANPFAFF